MTAEIESRLKEVRLVISDVDGTLSHGIRLDYEGRENKIFCEKDAPRIAAIIKNGIPFVMISGRNSSAARVRAKELKVDFYHRAEMIGQEAEEPLSFLEKRYGVTRGQMLYIGDDWADLWWMNEVLISAAPADAEEVCRSQAQIVTEAKGGKGAVSEVLVMLLKAQGLYDKVVSDQYRKPKFKATT